MAGTFVLTDTIKKSYDDITANVYRSTDAVVRSARETEAPIGRRRRPEARSAPTTLDRGAAGQRREGGRTAATAGIAVVVGHDGSLLDANRNRSPPVALRMAGLARAQPDDTRSPATRRRAG